MPCKDAKLCPQADDVACGECESTIKKSLTADPLDAVQGTAEEAGREFWERQPVPKQEEMSGGRWCKWGKRICHWGNDSESVQAIPAPEHGEVTYIPDPRLGFAPDSSSGRVITSAPCASVEYVGHDFEPCQICGRVHGSTACSTPVQPAPSEEELQRALDGMCSDYERAEIMTRAWRSLRAVLADRSPRSSIFHEINAERERQDAKWGVQEHPMIPEEALRRYFEKTADYCRNNCDKLMKLGEASWYDILREEFYEAFAESDAGRQREELVQVAAVAVEIIEYLDRHKERSSS